MQFWNCKLENLNVYVGFEAVTAVTLMSTVFWVVILCNLEKAQCFGGTYHLHVQGHRVS
jgi:Ca2+/H+ antiporter